MVDCYNCRTVRLRSLEANGEAPSRRRSHTVTSPCLDLGTVDIMSTTEGPRLPMSPRTFAKRCPSMGASSYWKLSLRKGRLQLSPTTTYEHIESSHVFPQPLASRATPKPRQTCHDRSWATAIVRSSEVQKHCTTCTARYRAAMLLTWRPFGCCGRMAISLPLLFVHVRESLKHTRRLTLLEGIHS